MKNNLTKILINMMLTITGLLSVTAIAVTLWLKDTSRPSNLANNLVISKIAKFYPAVTTKIAETRLALDYEKAALVLVSEDFVVTDQSEGHKLFSAKDLVLTFKLLDLLRGRFVPYELDINRPKLILGKKGRAANEVTIGVNLEETIKDYAKTVTSVLEQGEFNSIEKISIKKGDLIYRDNESEYIYEIYDGNIGINKVGGNTLAASVDFLLVHEGEEVLVDTDLSLNGQSDFKFSLKFTEVSSAFVKKIFRKTVYYNEMFRNLKIAAKGEFLAVGNLNDGSVNLTLVASDGYGNYKNSDLFPSNIEFEGLELSALYQGDEDKLYLNKFYAKLPEEEEIEITGSLKVKEEIGSFKVVLTNFYMNNLKIYWPINLAVEARKFVTENIKDAFITSAKAKFNLDFALLGDGKLPKDFIQAEAHFKGMRLQYLREMPEIVNINGIAKFDDNAIQIFSDHAESLSSTIKNAKVKVPFGKSNFKVDLDAAGQISDIAGFIDKETTNIINNSLKQEDFFGNTKGAVKAKISLSFPLISSLSYKDINIAVDSDIENLSTNNIFGKIGLHGGNFKSKLDGKYFKLEGQGFIDNGEPYNLKLEADITSRKMSNLNLATKISFKELDRTLGAGLVNYGAGDIALTLNYDGDIYKVNANFDGAEINIGELNYRKPFNQQAQLSFNLQNLGDVIDITELVYKADRADLSGYLKVKEENRQYMLASANLHTVRFGKHDFSLAYSSGGVKDVRLVGKALDASLVDFKDKLFGRSNQKKGGGYNFLAQLGKVYLQNDVVIYNLAGNMKYSSGRTDMLKFQSKLGDQKMAKFEVYKDNAAKRHYLLEAGDTGKLLMGLGLYNKIKGGNLYLTMTSDKDQHYTGDFRLTEFAAVKVPFLLKLLTLSSPISSLVGRLDSAGLPFEEFTGSFEVNNGVLTLEKVRSIGPFLSIVADGDIDFENNTVNVSGSMIPTVEGLNEALTKIPLIGKILAGGEDLGIIGTTYSIKGSLEEFKASVNPLSLLAPGFLRKFFE